MNATRNEVKYQLLKLVHSGRSFTEAKAMMKSVTGAFLQEYTSEADLNDILSLEGGLLFYCLTPFTHFTMMIP